MVNTPERPPGERGYAPESMQTLAEYLELSLDGATSVVMMRHGSDVCTVYVGDPAGLPEDLKKQGAISARLANEMLELTHSGANQMEIDGQAYRFVRSFTQVGDSAAVVFSAT
ncbi:hypothetical protein [Paraburkholderia sp. BL10I2N1]|uniref:hypothetical protein n=1 Tax=Paraburkholderia sp. BL10I2N1 TaxID=1938796 RepID=UPI00105DDC89|nr:hypothetical protein [Paraburkholderia sp. BL10I2N1]TDN62150.1 hypothetical protein B0G77_5684 [Paraburkholderia sp. BL10I2N1]